MITVLAGDFKKDGVAVFKKAMLGLGKPTHLAMPVGMLKSENIPLSDIVGAQVVTEAGLNAAGAVVGGLAFGAVGAIAGAVVGSGKVVELTFRDGRKALVKCGGPDLTTLTTAAYENAPA